MKQAHKFSSTFKFLSDIILNIPVASLFIFLVFPEYILNFSCDPSSKNVRLCWLFVEADRAMVDAVFSFWLLLLGKYSDLNEIHGPPFLYVSLF